MRQKRRDAPKHVFQKRSGHEALGDTGQMRESIPIPKDTSKPDLGLVKTLDEIRRIAQQRDIQALDALSKMELSVLLATLNRLRVDLEEEAAFTAFYLEVADRIQIRGQGGAG